MVSLAGKNQDNDINYINRNKRKITCHLNRCRKTLGKKNVISFYDGKKAKKLSASYN